MNQTSVHAWGRVLTCNTAGLCAMSSSTAGVSTSSGCAAAAAGDPSFRAGRVLNCSEAANIAKAWQASRRTCKAVQGPGMQCLWC